MNSRIHTLLLSADVRGSWEYPPDFNWESSVREIEKHKGALENIMSAELELDANAQDASFFADIYQLETSYAASGAPQAVIYHFALRFSNYGRLFTLLNESACDNVEQRQLQSCIAYLEAQGYVYIPVSELDCPYDGVNAGEISPITWWTRYFDYL
ncbi:hypothetical protein EUZ85_19575 [Hahella sp. KA22]|uniref:hypothetical protein n=1 Tax=Hahella sp. KA22 TaxID=1628392 RepID=UPI000FDD46FD|nr:hypothetical protein [Hahella sp. KA22]AZZ92805.1 hypothetical protein ENC22_16995 [Hahella sp. KA22]QAY56179.1 hypothetical protein EUZ85_19575 [Hahella sp. KA22]